jgi:tetratricopeptide (TPR) repeat protein
MPQLLSAAFMYSWLCLLLSCGTESAPTSDPEARLEDVRVLLDSWRGERSTLERARSELNAILKQNPRSAPANREFARYYAMSGYSKNYDVSLVALAAAEGHLAMALILDPTYSEAYVLQGHVYFLEGRYQEAKDALAKAEVIGSNDPWLQIGWADILMEENDLKGAASRLLRVYDSRTKNPKAFASAIDGLITYYRRTNRDADAQKMYREQIAFDPDVAWSYGGYAGFLLCRMDQADAAIAQFRIANSKMRYGVAISGLAAAYSRKRAATVLNGKMEAGAKSLEDVQALRARRPVEFIESYCKTGPAVDAVKRAVSLPTPTA